MTPHLQRYYDKGYEAQHAGTYYANSTTIFAEMHGSMPASGPEWYAFCEGGFKAGAEIAARKRAAYRVDEFVAKVRALCAEYDASISTGCGCCGGGLYVKDYETELHTDKTD